MEMQKKNRQIPLKVGQISMARNLLLNDTVMNHVLPISEALRNAVIHQKALIKKTAPKKALLRKKQEKILIKNRLLEAEMLISAKNTEKSLFQINQHQQN